MILLHKYQWTSICIIISHYSINIIIIILSQLSGIIALVGTLSSILGSHSLSLFQTYLDLTFFLLREFVWIDVRVWPRLIRETIAVELFFRLHNWQSLPHVSGHSGTLLHRWSRSSIYRFRNHIFYHVHNALNIYRFQDPNDWRPKFHTHDVLLPQNHLSTWSGSTMCMFLHIKSYTFSMKFAITVLARVHISIFEDFGSIFTLQSSQKLACVMFSFWDFKSSIPTFFAVIPRTNILYSIRL